MASRTRRTIHEQRPSPGGDDTRALQSSMPLESNGHLASQMSGGGGEDESVLMSVDSSVITSTSPASSEAPPSWSQPMLDEGPMMSVDPSVATTSSTAPAPAQPQQPEIDMAQIQDRSHRLFQAMDGMGTDEDSVHAALQGMTGPEIAALEAEFQNHYNRDLRSMLRSEMSGGDLAEAESAMTGDPVAAAIATLNNSVGFLGDDESQIEATLRGMTDEQREQLQERMPAEQLTTIRSALVDWVPDGEDGADAEVFDALMSGNAAEAAAIRLDEAMGSSSSWYNPTAWGTDEEAVYSALESMPAAERSQIVSAFDQRMASRGVDSDLATQLDEEFDDAEEDIATRLAEGDDLGARAARIMAAGEGMGTDEQAIFDGLSDPRLQSTDPAVREAALAERGELIERFETMYGQSMQDMLQEELDELDTERAEQLRQNGELDPAFAVFYASEAGLGGTDEDMIRSALANRSPAEIEAIQARYDAEYAGRYGASFEATLDAELSGRDRFDVHLLRTYGNTTDPAQLVERMEEQYQFERGTGSNDFSRAMMDVAGTIGYSSSAEVLDTNYERLQGCLDEDGNIVDTEGIQDVLRWNNDDVADNVAARESVTEGLATGAEITAAAIATAVSDGAASPWLIAALGALSGGAAGVGIRAGMGGDAYGQQEFGEDALNVLVQSAAAGLSNGIVDPRLEGLLEGQPEVLGALVNGAAGGAVDGVAGAAMDEDAYRGGVDEYLLGMGRSALASSGTGAVTGIARHGTRQGLERLPERMRVDPNSYSGAAARGAVTGFAGGVAGSTVNPDTYEGRVEDMAGRMATGGTRSAASGALQGMSNLRNRARVGARDDLARGRVRTAEELSGDGWSEAQISEYQQRMAGEQTAPAEAVSSGEHDHFPPQLQALLDSADPSDVTFALERIREGAH